LSFFSLSSTCLTRRSNQPADRGQSDWHVQRSARADEPLPGVNGKLFPVHSLRNKGPCSAPHLLPQYNHRVEAFYELSLPITNFEISSLKDALKCFFKDEFIEGNLLLPTRFLDVECLQCSVKSFITSKTQCIKLLKAHTSEDLSNFLAFCNDRCSRSYRPDWFADSVREGAFFLT